MRKNRSELIFIGLAVAGAVLALLLPALIRGEGLLPVGSLWRVPPWDQVLLPTAGNGLLSDQLLDFWPWRLFMRSELVHGRFPLWNPLIAAGVPFAGCVQAAPFFPTNLLLFFLSPASWSLAAAFLKLFVAGFFTALHARRLGAQRSGAALAGISFSLCGFMVAWLGHPQTNVACLLPALFWALGRGFQIATPRSWIPMAVVIGLILLGGHPPTALHVLGAGAAYAFFLVFRAPSQCRTERLVALGLAALIGFALAAPALLPYLEYLRLSSTVACSAALARWSTRLPPWAILNWLMPLASGSPVLGAEVLGAAFGLTPASNFLERAGWVGLPALAFVAIAVSRRFRDPAVRFHAGLALFGLACVLGAPGLPWLWKHLSVFSQANPTRLLILFCFGMATLAGLGCEGEAATNHERFWLVAIFAVALVLDFVALARVWSGLTTFEARFALSQSAFFVAEAAAAYWLVSGEGARRWAPLVAGLFLWRVAIGVNPSAPASLIYPRTSGIETLAAEQGQGRVMGLGAAVAPDLGMALGLRDARGRDFTMLRRYEELVTGTAGDFDFFQNASGLLPTSLFALSAVAATPKTADAVPADWSIVHRGDLLVFRAPSPGRRAIFVPLAESASSAQVLKKVRTPGFDPAKRLWLDDGPVPSIGDPNSHGTANIVTETSDELLVQVRADGPGWLVLLDNWYPGWRVDVNGTSADLRRGDYSFRAVGVPRGASTVRFRYVPLSFQLGLLMAGLGILALIAAWRC